MPRCCRLNMRLPAGLQSPQWDRMEHCSRAYHSGTGFLNVNDAMGSGGLQHALTARDSIGVSYYYSAFH